MKKIITQIATITALTFTAPSFADEPVDLNIINKIRDQAFNHSEVVETLQYLTDVIGPRLTGTPQMKEANNWTMEKFEEWGLEDNHLEGFEFGQGWTFSKAYIHMTSPRELQLSGMPVSWHPGTNGILEGEVIEAQMTSKADFEKYKGKLKGKIVLLSKPRAFDAPRDNSNRRRSEQSLIEKQEYDIPNDPGESGLAFFKKFIQFASDLDSFLAEERAIAAFKISPRSEALIEAGGYLHRVNQQPKVPLIAVTAEDYSKLIRLQRTGSVVKASLDVEVDYHPEDSKSYSTFGEIKGRGRNPEIVMAGGHLDSWFAGDGATDDGAGVAVVMEAMRILKAIGVEPKRTIRAALWGGEEQGLFGSIQYVSDHFASRPLSTKEEDKNFAPFMTSGTNWPITTKSDYNKLSGYFNLDNGGGRIRGINYEANVAIAPIFRAWLEPFADLSANHLSPDQTGGSDHLAYQNVGLPGFQFIQDQMDYGTTLHHSQVDTLDNINPKDLKQASAIMASFLYHAAMRDDMLPRKAFPTEPSTRVDFGAKR